MGCWLQTDMITQTPIMEGERVKLIFLAPGFDLDKGASGYCYQTGLFFPMFLPISGEYNDYGYIKNYKEDDARVQEAVEGIKRRLREKKLVIPNTSRVIKDFNKSPKNIDKLNLDKIFDLTHDSDLKFTDDMALGCVQILEEVWDWMVEYVKKRKLWYPKKPSGEEYTYEEYYNEILDGLVAKKKLILAARAKGSSESKVNAALEELRISLSQTRFDLFDYHEVGHDIEAFLGVTYAEAACTKGQKKYAERLRKDILELRYVSTFLLMTRKGWVMQSGAGSQDVNYEKLLDLSKMTVSMLEKKIKKYRDD